MFSITVTIGRNVTTSHPHPARAGRPLTLTEWSDFQADVRLALGNAVVNSADIEAHYGKGAWGGVEEDSFKVTALVSDMALVSAGALRRELASLAKEYGQDAIALTIGLSDLIFAA